MNSSTNSQVQIAGITANQNTGAQIGEEGTEQFTVECRVDGQPISTQKIHDPFISNVTKVWMSRWDHLWRVFFNRPSVVEINVRGSEGAQRAIMTLDPNLLAADSEAILEARRLRGLRAGANTEHGRFSRRVVDGNWPIPSD